MNLRCGLLLIGALLALAPARAQLEGDREKGKRLYTYGTAERPLTAQMNEPPIDVPASALPCVGCHGDDGRGRPEGGMNPSNITWSALTRPYEVTAGEGRKRGPYTPDLLARAVTRGIDSSGQKLDPVMPRYGLNPQETQDLIAWLQHLEHRRDPGVSDDTLVIGLLTAPEEARPNHARLTRSMVGVAAETINRRGGLYGRKLKVVELSRDNSPAQHADQQIRRFLEEEQPFVMVAPDLSGQEAHLATAFEVHQTPVIGAVTSRPQLSDPVNPYIFYLHAGHTHVAQALAAQLARTETGKAAIVYNPHDASTQDAVAAAEAAAAEAGFSQLAVHPLGAGCDPQAMGARLKTRGFQSLLVLGAHNPQCSDALLRAYLKDNPHASVYIDRTYLSGQTLHADPPPNHMVVGFPQDLKRETSQGLQLYQQFAAAYLKNPDRPTAVERNALVSMVLLQEALLRCGRDVTRRGLIDELEKLHGFDPGLGPRLSFGPNRRVGSRAVQIKTLVASPRPGPPSSPQNP